MIEYIKGDLAELTPAYAVLDVCGLGYKVNISVNTYSVVQAEAQKGQTEAKLYIYEAIREDAHDLYGFCTQKEREVFLLLLTVSGIGANTARMILSEMTVDELCGVIAVGDERMLKRIKGIGPRSAARIIVELKDKFAGSELVSSAMQSAGSENGSEAVSALTMLGFSASASAKAVQEVLKTDPTASVETIIKKALTMVK